MVVMKHSGKTVSVALAVAATLSLGAPPAKAQNLFEALFGGGIRHRRSMERYEFPPEPRRPVRQQQRRSAAAAPKITGPSYYTYKTDTLAKADFTAVATVPQPAAFEPVLTGATFREALPGLQGFELTAEKDIAKALSDYYAANPDFIWVSG